MKILRPLLAGRSEPIGFAAAMIALGVLVLFGEDHPWPALIAIAGVATLWGVIHAIKKWWKSGSRDFDKIMEEELPR